MLREAVAASYDARGLATRPDQVMIVTGALAGVAVAARALLSTGDRALVESPTYPNAIATLTHSGARLVGVDVPPDAAVVGSDVEGLTATLRQVAPRVAYLIPDFHNPTGALMSDAAREQVARVLTRTRTTAVIDESMVALALDGQELPAPFASYAPDAISVGSLSKPYWGGLRIGWLRIPEARVDAFFRARLSLDLGAPLLEQLVATELVNAGSELLDHRREQLRASRDAALAAIAEHLPDWRVSRPGGGLEPVVRAAGRAVLGAGRPRPRATTCCSPPGRPSPPRAGSTASSGCPTPSPRTCSATRSPGSATAWRETLADPGFVRGGAPTLVA